MTTTTGSTAPIASLPFCEVEDDAGCWSVSLSLVTVNPDVGGFFLGAPIIF